MMGSMKDLLGDTPYETTYPAAPGYKTGGTSKEAAAALGKHRASTLRDLALAAIAEASPDGLTADQVATRLNMTVLAIRPRVSELSEMRLIEPTGKRRPNISGQSAMVWRIR